MENRLMIEQQLTILLWAIGGGFGVLFALMAFMWNSINSRFEKLEQRLEKLEDRLTRLENDMIEVKTVLRLKDCCMIKDDRQIKKAE